MAARKAERGATSMDWVQARRMRKRIEGPRVEGTGMRARQIAEGRWVNTIVCEGQYEDVDRGEGVEIEEAKVPSHCLSVSRSRTLLTWRLRQ